MSVYTEFGVLEEVVVGREYQIEERILDFSFKNMYKDNMHIADIYDNTIDNYKISSRLIKERNEDLDNLANQLRDLGVKVFRPDVVKKVENITSPTYKTVTSSASNVRDIVLTYGNKIIETPILVRNRLFENRALHGIFNEKLDDGYMWYRSPHVDLTTESLDLEDWKDERDFSHINYTNTKYQMGIDAAHCLRIGKDMICNVATYNHYLGYKWLQKMLPECNIHRVKLCDSHIDGVLMVLRPGTFIMNNHTYTEKNLRLQLPKKFRDWEIIKICDGNEPYYDEDEMYDKFNDDLTFNLASSRGMDLNVLSIDEKRVMVLDRATTTIKILKEHGFDVIPVKLRHGEVFAGGIHCSTLDIRRKDEFRSY